MALVVAKEAPSDPTLQEELKREAAVDPLPTSCNAMLCYKIEHAVACISRRFWPG